MISVKIEVNVTVEDIEVAKEIADDLHNIMSDSGITNSVNIEECE